MRRVERAQRYFKPAVLPDCARTGTGFDREQVLTLQEASDRHFQHDVREA